MVFCAFTMIKFTHGEQDYGCKIHNKQTPENKRLDLDGFHDAGKNRNDVVTIQFTDCRILKFPFELTEIFHNLRNLVICNSKLKKISKNDLAEYKNLRIISMRNNEIEYLPGDLFEGFRYLNYINFQQNKLVFIEPNILDGLGPMRYVDFSENPNYKICFSIYPIHEPNATLEEVKKELNEKFYSRFQFLKKDQEKAEENFRRQMSMLNCSIQLLERKNQQLESNEQRLELKVHELNKKLELKEKEILALNNRPEKSSSLTSNLKNYIQNEDTKDFKIKIDDREFPVHKFLLIIQSPTFGEILQNNPDIESINLVDIPIPVFKKVLKFLYTDEIKFDDDENNALQIFAAAGRLKIKKLIDISAEKLIHQVNPENAFEIFNLSVKCQKEELKIKAFGEVKKKYSNIIKFEDEWLGNTEKLKFIIEVLKEKEEADRKCKMNLEKILSKQ